MPIYHPPDKPMPTPKVILEGTHLTRKTDIAFALAEHRRIIGERRHRWHIPLVSSEWETICDDPFPTKGSPGRSAIDFEAHQEAWAMDAFHTWMRLFELHRDYYWIVDRFHVSTRSYQLRHSGRDYSFSWLEERLAALDFRLVLCVRSPDSFPAARQSRMKYSENPRRYDDLELFVREQELLRKLVAESSLVSTEIDVSSDDVDAAADQIIEWVEATGAFWPRPR